MGKKYFEGIDPLFYKGVAHRGLHDETRDENSLAAFKAAVDGKMAFEYDLHLTKDGRLVVFHDDNLLRMTGKEGVIEEMTFDELRASYRLPHGEAIPSFEEVLALNPGYFIPMVIELKVVDRNYKALAKAFKEHIARLGIPKEKAILISFDPRVLRPLRKLDYRVSFLIQKKTYWTKMFRGLFKSLDVEHCLLDEKLIQRQKKKGKPLIVWTIDSLEVAKSALSKGADILTVEGKDVGEIRKLL